jgi:protein-disulfide isomerase
MASRKEQKEAARAQRQAEEQARQARQTRARRLQMFGGVGLVAVAVVVALIVVSSGNSPTAPPTTTKGKAKVVQEVSALLKGIPQSGTVLGKPSAPVTMDYYGDLECPICMAFTTGEDGGGFPQLVANEVRQGKVKVDYHSLCTATCNDHGQSVFNLQQTAAYAAGKQDRFWDFAEIFYHEQQSETSDYVNQTFLDGIASQIPGLNVSEWKTDQGDPSYLSQVQADESAAATAGFDATPQLVFKGVKGSLPLTAGVATYSELQQAITQVS